MTGRKTIQRSILVLLIPWMSFMSWAQNPQWDWARSFGTVGSEMAKQVVSDPASLHVYVVGDWDTDLSASFPGGANPSTQFNTTYGMMDGFVAKYDQDGNLVWAFKIGGENNDQVNSIALDMNGNIYITGMMGEDSAIYFSGTSPHTASSILSNTSDQDFFLAKYNPDGEFLWVRQSECDAGDLIGQDVTLTRDAVFAVGIATGRAFFGALNMASVPNAIDIFLVRYSLDGTESWIAQAGSNQDDLVHEVVADETHAFYIGHFAGSNLNLRDASGFTAFSENNVQIGSSDIVVAAYDQEGNYAWSQTIASSGDDEGLGMTLDTDSLYITGAIHDNASFPGYAGNPLNTSAGRDIFLASLAKLDGATGWVQVLPCSGSGDEQGRCLEMNVFGNIYMTGDFNSDLQFPAGVTISAIGNEDVFVAAFTAQGEFRWAQSAGSSNHDVGYGLAADREGAIYISGRFEDDMNFGPLMLPYNGNRDGFLARLKDTIMEVPFADPGPYWDICGSSLGLQAILSTGVGAWSLVSGPGSAVFTPSENDLTVSVTVDQYGSYSFAWTETNMYGSDDSIFTVEFSEPTLADAGTGGDTCGADFPLSALPSIGTGIWTMAGGPGIASFTPSANMSDAMVTVDMPGLYQFTWTETNGTCASQASVEVNFLETLVVEAGPDVTVCGQQHGLNVLPQEIPGQWTTSNGPGNVTFSPSATDPLARVSVDAPGEYLFRWTASQDFCSGEDSVMVSFARQPMANAGADQVLEHVFSTSLEAQLPAADVAAVNANGTWRLVSGSGIIENPNDPATRVSGLGLGENVFQWTISSDFCPDASDEVLITVNDLETYTVITPNNDGLNDVLFFSGIEELTACEIIIYNRWGTEVYRDADYRNNWDGRDKNDRPLIQDTYYYILRIPPDRIIKSFVEIRRSQ